MCFFDVFYLMCIFLPSHKKRVVHFAPESDLPVTRTARSASKNARAARNPSPSGVLRLCQNLRKGGTTPSKKEGSIIIHMYVYMCILHTHTYYSSIL